jgi:hypothetical protein
MNVPMQCPLVLLVKVVIRESEAFCSVEGTVMRTGAQREDGQVRAAFDWNF